MSGRMGPRLCDVQELCGRHSDRRERWRDVGETQENMGKTQGNTEKMQGNTEKTQGDTGRCREMQGDAGTR